MIFNAGKIVKNRLHRVVLKKFVKLSEVQTWLTLLAESGYGTYTTVKL